MAVRSHWDAERGVLFVTLEGELTDEDLLEYAQQATGRQGEVPNAHDELVDLRSAREGEINAHVLRRIAELFGRTDSTPEQSRVAIVADQDVAYGLARMYQAFRSESPLDLRVFRELAEARAWLGIDSGPS